MSDNTPTEKAPEGEPGVEDIRSQWQKLDAGASTPKNLLDWQMRQRALKEEERQRKTASAAILHNYRGDLKESDTKLAALREEERKKKMNAESILHNYRAPVGSVKSGTKKKTSAATADAVASTPGMRKDIMKGDVAGIAESFNVSKTEDVHISGNPISMRAGGTAVGDEVKPSSDGPGATNEPPPAQGREPVLAVPASQPTLTEVASLTEDTPAEPSATEDLSNSGVLVREPELVHETAQLHNDDWVTITPPDEKSVPAANPNEGAAYMEGDQTNAQPAVIATQTEPMKQPTAPTNQPRRVDVDFSFGVLSNVTEAQPSLSKYMQAIDEIVQRTLSGSAVNITYNPSYQPFVSSLEKDDSYAVGRNDVVRYVVHGVIPVFVLNENDVRTARVPIRGALKAAVKDGSFLSTALRFEKAGLSA